MPDEKDNINATDVDEESTTDTPLHAYKEGREEDIEGEMPRDKEDPKEATDRAKKSGGATSGGPPREAGQPAEDDPSKLDD
jgi:hypothetical protein